ncbi:MAG: hypothetical protein ABEI77_05525 [Halorientalis sp.]
MDFAQEHAESKVLLEQFRFFEGAVETEDVAGTERAETVLDRRKDT